MCAAFLAQWLWMLWVTRQRERFYDDCRRRRGSDPPSLRSKARYVRDMIKPIDPQNK
jgi:hypothetical protein